jgi:hypothetical protein
MKNQCVEKLSRLICIKEGFQLIKKVAAISVYDGMEWDGGRRFVSSDGHALGKILFSGSPNRSRGSSHKRDIHTFILAHSPKF